MKNVHGEQLEEYLIRILKQLVQMDVGEERWQFFRNLDGYNEICEYVLKKTCPGLWRENCCSGGTRMGSSQGSGSDDETEIMYYSAAIALKETVQYFRLKEETGEIVQKFLGSDGQKLKQEHRTQMRTEMFEAATGSMGIGTGRKSSGESTKKELARLWVEWNRWKTKVLQSTGKTVSEEDSFQQFRREMRKETICSGTGKKRYKFGDIMFDRLWELILKTKLESQIIENEDGEETNRWETIPDINHPGADAAMLEKEERGEMREQIGISLDQISCELSLLRMKDRELSRAFYTEELLKALKLYQETRWKENGEAEVVSKRYVAYPAGNTDMYELMTLHEKKYLDLFVDAYVHAAVEEAPESLEDLFGIYYNLLQSGFKFTNTEIGTILGLDKSMISRGRKRHEEMKKRITAYVDSEWMET